MLVINSIEKTRLSADSYSYQGTGVAWKARLVLFLGFALMAGGLAGSVVSGRELGAILEIHLELLTVFSGCACSKICCSRISIPYALLRRCQCNRQWFNYAQVCAFPLDSAASIDTSGSSVVLWVSQNMEDDYTYNLAL